MTESQNEAALAERSPDPAAPGLPLPVIDADPGDENDTRTDAETNEDTVADDQLGLTLEALYDWVIGGIDLANVLAEKTPSRELSIIVTRLEEAELWLLRLQATPTQEEPA